MIQLYLCFKNKVILLLVVVLSMFLTACSSSYHTQPTVHYYRSSNNNDPIFRIVRLIEQHRQWKGTRYRLGGMSRSGVDCSGFTLVTFRDAFGISLPRTTVLQAKKGKYIPKKDLQPGDLVFFKTGLGPHGKHVGIYVKDGKFLHASSKKGVIYSNLNSVYWKKVYWQARRL
ncbi:C40 family peptidase [Phocoenobacter skyensis]